MTAGDGDNRRAVPEKNWVRVRQERAFYRVLISSRLLHPADRRYRLAGSIHEQDYAHGRRRQHDRFFRLHRTSRVWIGYGGDEVRKWEVFRALFAPARGAALRRGPAARARHG